MKRVTFNNIKHPDYYNKCTMCNSAKNLQECNDCIELYCTKCDVLNNTNCKSCICYKRKEITSFIDNN